MKQRGLNKKNIRYWWAVVVIRKSKRQTIFLFIYFLARGPLYLKSGHFRRPQNFSSRATVGPRDAVEHPCSKTPTSEVGLPESFCIYNTEIFSNSWMTDLCVQLITKRREPHYAFEKSLDFMLINAMKCNWDSVFVRYLHYACFPNTIRHLASY